MEDEAIEDLKLKINNLIWMYGPGSMTLDVAERIACDTLSMIRNGTDAEQMLENLKKDA